MNETAARSAAARSPVFREPSAVRIAGYILLGLAAILYLLHFVHLNADFPNHSPWVDWSKYTDEGWYGDAAIRHYLTGHWYWKGDFNPAVALPVWPAIELVWFKIAGVSPVSARVLTLLVFAVTLAAIYRLVQHYTRVHAASSGPSLAAPLAVFLLCASPLLFVFERMAILEPLLIALTTLALLAATHLRPLALGRAHSAGDPASRFAHALPSLALATLLPAMVLTKTTAICLLPAILYLVWARAGYRLRPALRMVIPPAVLGIVLWCAYFFLFVRPHYLEDYRYLFSANAYTGIELEPLAKVVLNTLGEGAWMGTPVYAVFFIIVAFAFFWRPRLLANPLVPALLLWIAGYFAFLAYHNNLQPRYYTVVAVPITVIVAIGLDDLRVAFHRQVSDTPGATYLASSRLATKRWASTAAQAVAIAVVLLIAIPGIVQQIDFLLRPTYDFKNAAANIKQIILHDHTHPHLILSISGSDLTLMTGLPSIDDDFGTLDLGERVKQYRPGWYAAWNELDDDKADALTPFYRVVRVAEFPAFDDPDRNLLILYRLDPIAPTSPQIHAPTHPKRHTPRPLVTRLGQQPSMNQLEH
jgi:hypothetical protein